MNRRVYGKSALQRYFSVIWFGIKQVVIKLHFFIINKSILVLLIILNFENELMFYELSLLNKISWWTYLKISENSIKER